MKQNCCISTVEQLALDNTLGLTVASDLVTEVVQAIFHSRIRPVHETTECHDQKQVVHGYHGKQRDQIELEDA